MPSDPHILDKIDALHDSGLDFVEREQAHGVAVEYQFDRCRFDEWRRKVNDLLYSLGGCEDIYYQRFSKEVTRPHVRDLEAGLRILSAVRDDVSRAILREATGKPCPAGGCAKPSVGFH
ncbi:MAG TPA: hypothetical protein VK463_00165 [Desulfomonilaceae bacterium]|nr:hypothetical protein [Desulfomonilaceae bacterium]